MSSSINSNGDFYKDFSFELGKEYQMSIQQWKHNGTYWYEIIIDGISKFKIENKQPRQYSSVELYTSDPWYEPFTSEFGSICNIKIQQGAGK